MEEVGKQTSERYIKRRKLMLPRGKRSISRKSGGEMKWLSHLLMTFSLLPLGVVLVAIVIALVWGVPRSLENGSGPLVFLFLVMAYPIAFLLALISVIVARKGQRGPIMLVLVLSIALEAIALNLLL